MPAKTVLCFGDSLTWGFDPASGNRFPFESRWPGVVQERLGARVRIIEEALNGRTTVFNDSFVPHRSGLELLPVLLESHWPLDIVIMMLGGNDVQPYRHLSALEAARGCTVLIDTIRSSAYPARPPKVVLVAPPPMKTPCGLMGLVFTGGEAESHKLGPAYREVAKARGCRFVDAGELVTASDVDGVHIDAEAQRALGLHLAGVVEEILGRPE